MSLSRGALRRSRLGVVVLGLALALSACTTPGPGPNPAASQPVISPNLPVGLQPYYTQHIAFTSCKGDGEVMCGWVKVPLDYNNVTLGSMRLRVAYRHAGEDGSGRLGFLFTNPGGPGASGLEIPFHALDYMSSKLTQHFDVLGWDPRGVGHSEPIACLTNKQKDVLISQNATPTTAADIAKYVAAQKAFAKACKVKNPKTYNHVGTVAAARDMDIIRAALGQNSMYYLGYSYGTSLGAWYADLFPERITRMVLDGAMNPALNNTQLSYEQLKGFEHALYRFLEWCPTSSACPPILDVPQKQRINVIVAEQDALARHPAPTDNKKRKLTESLFQTGVVYTLYDDSFGWPELASALRELFVHDNGTFLLELADAYVNRQSNGTYPDNSVDAFNAVTCYDKPPTPGVAGTQPLATSWSTQFPVFGANFAWANMTCAYWPAHTDQLPAPLHATGSGPIVVVGTTYDPATSYDQAVALSHQLDNGHLITWIGDGHTAYNRGSGCIQHAVDDYLLHGFVPKAGLVCPSIGPPK